MSRSDLPYQYTHAVVTACGHRWPREVEEGARHGGKADLAHLGAKRQDKETIDRMLAWCGFVTIEGRSKQALQAATERFYIGADSEHEPM